MVYGYCRISRRQQSIERQIRNILKEYPDAVIYQEAYTGTRVEGRKEFEKLVKRVKKGDTIVFDSVSRMSRNADEGIKHYSELYAAGVELVFLKESYINTEVYKRALQNQVSMTGESIDLILEGVNKYLQELAKEQIRIAFGQAEKEVLDLHERTREGIETARLAGKQIGQKKGAKLITKKSLEAKEKIKKYNRDFTGTLNNEDTIKLIGISKNTFYKYKRELFEESSRVK